MVTVSDTLVAGKGVGGWTPWTGVHVRQEIIPEGSPFSRFLAPPDLGASQREAQTLRTPILCLRCLVDGTDTYHV